MDTTQFDIGTILTIILGLAALGAIITRQLNRIIKPLRAEMAANRASIKYIITKARDDYRRLGHISKHAMQSLLEMYDSYKQMGGNSFAEKMIEDIKIIPVDEEE